MRPHAQFRDGGFALVESIAVLALSALVLLALLIATSLVTRNSGAATRRANAVENLATGLDALRRDIAAARFARGGGDAQAPILFEGSPRALAFVAGDDGSGSGSAENMIRIEARSDARQGALVRSSAPLLPQMTGFAGATFSNATVVVAGPWSYRFSYAESQGGPPRWQASWQSRKALPGAVRLEVLDRTGARPALPPVVIGLNINAEVKCESEECEPAEDEEGTGEQSLDEEGNAENRDDADKGQDQ